MTEYVEKHLVENDKTALRTIKKAGDHRSPLHGQGARGRKNERVFEQCPYHLCADFTLILRVDSALILRADFTLIL